MAIGKCTLSMAFAVLLYAVLLQDVTAGPVTFNSGGYEGVVVAIADTVPADDCHGIIDKLEVRNPVLYIFFL